MLENCFIEELINLYFININNQKKLEATINTENNFTSKSIDLNIIKNLILSIINLDKKLSSYMLSVNDLFIDIDFIFIDDNKFRYVYLPNYNVDIYYQLLQIMKNVLDNIDYTDRDITTLCFAVYQMLESRKNFSEIEKFILTYNYISPDEVCIYENKEYKENIISENIHEKNSKKLENNIKVISENKKEIIFIVIGIILNIIVLSFGYLTNVNEKIIAILVLAICLGVYVLYKATFLIAKEKREKIDLNISKQQISSNEYLMEETSILCEEKELILKGKEDIRVYCYPFFIGSALGNDFVLNKNYVSKQHLKLYKKADKIYIHDLKSTNGTFVNGKKLKGSCQINRGDVVTVAKYEYIVEL